MGYKKARKLYVLKWPEGHENHGLEIEMRGLSVDKLAHIARMTSDIKDVSGIAGKFQELFEIFGSKLVSWNMTDDDDKPIPATMESVQEFADDDPYFIFGLIMAWATAVGSVDIPLPEGSSSGENLEDALTLGLASQSKSLGS